MESSPEHKTKHQAYYEANQDSRKRASNIYYYTIGKVKRQERAAERKRLKEERKAEEKRAEERRREQEETSRSAASVSRGHVDLEVSTDLLEPGPRPRGVIPKALLEALVLKDDLVAWKSAWGGVSTWRGMHARYAAGDEDIQNEYEEHYNDGMSILTDTRVIFVNFDVPERAEQVQWVYNLCSKITIEVVRGLQILTDGVGYLPDPGVQSESS